MSSLVKPVNDQRGHIDTIEYGAGDTTELSRNGHTLFNDRAVDVLFQPEMQGEIETIRNANKEGLKPDYEAAAANLEMNIAPVVENKNTLKNKTKTTFKPGQP